MQPIGNPKIFRVIAVLCLLLVCVSSVAQVTHDHANDAKAARHCSICISAHSTLAVATVSASAPFLFRKSALVEERESVTSLLLSENAYIRPPPVA
jgi:hypothetical protein